MKCRRCRVVEGTIFYDAQNTPTKTPVCRDCYEEMIRHCEGKGGYRTGYIGHERDPFHRLVDPDVAKAREWYEHLYGKHPNTQF